MKWLFVCLAVLFMVAPAMAGQDPYIAIVGNDCVPGWVNSLTGTCPAGGTADPFYFSPKYRQFMYDQFDLAVPVCFPGTLPSAAVTPDPKFLRLGGFGCESFYTQTPVIQREICDEKLNTPQSTLQNAKVAAGNSGFFEWWIRLPKKPDGQINIVIECGVLKPNSSARPDAIELCAAETGERVGVGDCVRQEVDPGVSPIVQAALPKLTAVAYPGMFNSFTPFHLTAWKNPSSYAYADPLVNGGAMQVLDGSAAARILLKACMDKTIVAKLPVTGQVNAFSVPETETDLEMGDIIQVRLDIPRQGTVDVFCNAQSARLQGIGEFPF